MFVTPENPGEAISAVKALAKVIQAGQQIYHLTPANKSSTLPSIHHQPGTMDEIRAALAVGKEVITHTDPVTVSGWSGAGYIIFDPETGDGVYKIGGGANGGVFFGLIIGAALAIGLVVPALIATFLGLLVFGLSGLITTLVMVFNTAEDVNEVFGCALSAIVWGFGIEFAFLGLGGFVISAIEANLLAIIGSIFSLHMPNPYECIISG